MNQMSNPNRIVVEGVQKMTPSEAFIETLVSQGVTDVFGQLPQVNACCKVLQGDVAVGFRQLLLDHLGHHRAHLLGQVFDQCLHDRVKFHFLSLFLGYGLADCLA